MWAIHLPNMGRECYIGLSSPPANCIIPSSIEENGFSYSHAWPIGFDHNEEIIVWEEDVDFWDGLAMKEDSLRDKMIARQKSKGKRELLNLQSSINYGVVETSSKHRKGKVHMM
jgi:hypothetical protein